MDEPRGTLFDARWLAVAVGGSIDGNPDAAASSVEVDSRLCGPGSLFAALPGEREDGHDYLKAALEAGATILLAGKEGWMRRESALASALQRSRVAAVLVPDSLAGLQEAARAWRLRFPSLVRVGITGSSGKTTTKECLGRILATRFRTAVNPGNMNSEIGLPQAMFTLRPEHEVGVFEMGINHPGEMDALVRVWEPSHALITNIGTAHIGILGSRRAIAEEKRKIFSRIAASGAAFAWEDDDFLGFLALGAPSVLRTFGPRTLEGFEGSRDAGLDGWVIRYKGETIAFPLPGSHNLLDAMAAIS
ncbi:MAG TPA: Mur ligase family protein, partial [Magnetospirillaceae bacterium]|nr:Mur ligase family protein [Magnetospirillaceae bacterium]